MLEADKIGQKLILCMKNLIKQIPGIKAIGTRAHGVCCSLFRHHIYSALSVHAVYVNHVLLCRICVSLPREHKGQRDLRGKCPSFLTCDQKINTDQLKQHSVLNLFFPWYVAVTRRSYTSQKRPRKVNQDS